MGAGPGAEVVRVPTELGPKMMWQSFEPGTRRTCRTCRTGRTGRTCRTCKSGRTRQSGERGIALIVALLLLSILSAMGLGLALVASVDPMAGANQREAVSTLYVARAGLELAARELTNAASWDAWLSGATTSALVDGPASGVRTTPSGQVIDIERLTNQLLCARDAACSDAQVTASSRDRPWGVNNPRWRPFVYGAATHLGLGAASEQHYLVVWIGDDGTETDGRPDVDGSDGAGGGVVRVVAQAFGPFRSRQSVEARLSRRCEVVEATPVCEPGIRIQGWRVRGS